MPGGDRTGPMGQGPMTGRAAGYCVGSAEPGYMTPMPGGGFGNLGCGAGFRGGGGGRGRHNRYFATGIPGWCRGGWGYEVSRPGGAPFAPSMTKKHEIELLREQADYFKESLEDIKKHIDDLSAQEKEA